MNKRLKRRRNSVFERAAGKFLAQPGLFCGRASVGHCRPVDLVLRPKKKKREKKKKRRKPLPLAAERKPRALVLIVRMEPSHLL